MTFNCHQNEPLDRLTSRVVGENIAALLDEIRRPRPDHPPRFSPLDAFTLLFRERLNEAVVERTRRVLYDRQRRRPKNVAGVIYAFHDERDPHDIVKIGATRQMPDRRIAQWRTKLGADDRDDVTLLFYCETRAMYFAEDLIHAMLFCAWQPKRFVVHSNRRVVEYYRIDDRIALRRLCTYVARYTNWIVNKNLQY